MNGTMVRLQLNIFLGTVYSTDEERDGISPSPARDGSRRGGDGVSPSAQWSQRGDSNRRLQNISFFGKPDQLTLSRD